MKNKVTSILTAIIIIASFSVYAYDTWNPAETYAKAGSIVQYDGKLWKNQWWTKGDNPTGYYSNQWHVWRPAEVQPQENQAPTAVNDSVDTTENRSVTINPLINDTDPDNDAITLESVGAPSHGSAVVSANSIVYTPARDYDGSDFFSYSIADSEGNTASGTVNVTVNSTQVQPVTDGFSYTLTSDWGTGFSGNIKLTNNTGTASESWKVEFDFPYEITSIWNANKVSHSGNHYVIENLSWNGNVAPGASVSFGFGGKPGNLTAEPSNVKLLFTGGETPTPQAPIANIDSVTTEQNTPVTVDVLGNDTGEAVSLDSVTVPANGSAVISGDKIVYTPNAEFKGTDSFNYTITDALGVLAVGLVSVTVNEPSVINKVNATYWSAWGGNTSYSVDGKQISSQGVEMDKIDPSYNVIITAFIVTDSNGNYVLSLKDPGSTSPSTYTEEQVKEFINKTKAQGRKVIVSMGGQFFHLNMKTQADAAAFVTQAEKIIDEYGFEGLDIDLESGALASIDPTLMGNAIMEVVNHYRNNGVDFWLTAAPEWCYITPFVWGSGQWASYSMAGSFYKDLIAVIGINNFNHIWPQTYNQGPANGITGKDGSKVTPESGMDKFLAAMSWAISTDEGYNANGAVGVKIPGDKLAMGIPATEGAAGGNMTYVATPALIEGAFELMADQGVEISGFMNWSVDWDAMNIADGDLSAGYTHTPWETGRAVAKAINVSSEPVNLLPVINMTTPANNVVIEQEVLSAVNLEFNATDNDGNIASALIKVDGKTYNGTTANWTPAAFGTYVVTFNATDDEGASVNKNINVTIKEKSSATNQSPLISSVSPANGETVEMTSLSPVVLKVNASDSDGTVDSIKIEVDGSTFNGTSVSWTPSEFGTHTIYVTVTDNDGESATVIANINIVKQQGSSSSEIAFSSPKDGDVVKLEELSSINIAVSVSDSENVESVQIDVDGNSFDGYTANWTPSDFSSFAITAMVTYLSGTVQTKTINVQIAEDGTAGSAGFQVGGYWENWKGALNPGSSSSADSEYYENDIDNFSHVYYSFLTLAKSPNPDMPPKAQWDGQSIYESMSATDVITVMTKTDPTWKNEAEWQRLKIQALIDECHAKGKKFIWAIGGWSDLTQTISDEQIPAFVDYCVILLKVSGDGIDFDWEHLSSNPDLKVQQRHVIGKILPVLRKALDDNGMTDKLLGYTTRFNAFWNDSNRAEGALEFDSEGEGIDVANAAKAAGTTLNDCVDWVNIMMYDVPPGDAGAKGGLFELDNYKNVLSAFEKYVSRDKIVMGFEPGGQAAGGIWEGMEVDKQVIDYIASNGYGGVMFWAINQPALNSPEITGENSQELAGYAISVID